MQYIYKITFANKTLLALALLEIVLWGTDSKRYSVTVDGECYIRTSSKDVLDIVAESLSVGQYLVSVEKI